MHRAAFALITCLAAALVLPVTAIIHGWRPWTMASGSFGVGAQVLVMIAAIGLAGAVTGALLAPLWRGATSARIGAVLLTPVLSLTGLWFCDMVMSLWTGGTLQVLVLVPALPILPLLLPSELTGFPLCWALGGLAAWTYARRLEMRDAQT